MSLRAVVLIVALAIAASHLFSSRFTREMPDFEVYWTAAARARAGEPLYRESDGHYRFKYLPGFAVLASPLATVPVAVAKRMWFGVSVALLAILIALSVGVLPERRESRLALVAAAVVVMGKFYGHELVLGQVNLLFGALVVVSLAALRRRSEAAAGVSLAAAIVVKPYALLFLPWLAAIRRRRALAAALGGLVVALVLPILTHGMSAVLALHRSWWSTVTTTTAPNLLNQDNVSLSAMWAKWLGPGTLAGSLAVMSSLALLACFAFVLSQRRAVTVPEPLEGALLLVLIPLLSPQGWDYVFLVATPAVILIVNYREALPGPLRAVTLTVLAVIGLSLFDVIGRANYARFMSWSVISVCFLVVVAALTDLRRAAAA